MRPIHRFVLLYLLLSTVRCTGAAYYDFDDRGRDSWTTRVSGRVATAGGRGVPGVTIRAWGELPAGSGGCNEGGSWFGETVTDADGRYSIAESSTVGGSGTVTVSPATTAEYDFSPSSRSVAVTIGQSVAAIDFTANRMYAVSGTVLDGGGAPLPGTLVALSGGASGSAFAGDDGSYLFPRVPEGAVTLSPSLASHSFAPPYLAVVVGGGDSTGNDFTGTYIPHRISGRVTLFGQPFPGATVTASGPSGASDVTDASGGYDLGILPRGAYAVTASKTGYLPATRQADLSTADLVVDLAVVPLSNVVRGRVSMTDTGLPVADVWVRSSAGTGAYTDGSGRYALPLETGSYTLTPSTSCPTYRFAPASTPVELQGADRAGVDFTAMYEGSPSGSIGGRVTDSAGAGLGGVPVAVTGPDNVTATTGSDGSFSFPWLHNGTYSVGPSGAGYRFSPSSVGGIALCNSTSGGHLFREISSWSRYGYLSGSGEGEILAVRPLSSGYVAAGASARLMRVGPYGALLWAIRLGEGGEELSAVAEAPDDSFAAVGTGIAAGTSRREAIVARVAGDGTLLWYRRLGGTGDVTGRAAALFPDNGVLVAGTVGSDLFLARLGGDGALLWRKVYGGFVPLALRADGSGATVAAGEGTDGRMAVIRVDPSGAVLFSRGYRRGGGELLAATAARIGADDAVTFAGRFTFRDYGDANGSRPTKDGLWAMGTGADGQVAWQRAAGFSSLTDEEASAVLPGPGAGEETVLGRQRSSGHESVVLLRLLPDGATYYARVWQNSWPLRRSARSGLPLGGGKILVAGDATDYAYYGAWLASIDPEAGGCGPTGIVNPLYAATGVVRDDGAVTAVDGALTATPSSPAVAATGSAPQTECAY